MTLKSPDSQPRWLDNLQGLFFRIAASGVIPAELFERRLPRPAERAARTGGLHVEIVSHCWRYAHLLAYQLSSLVHDPPTSVGVTMTVFYCPEDRRTEKLLAFFESFQLANVTWNWQPLPKERLFRRAIGRNKAALTTDADWVWFTDCDVMFRDGCLDSLGERLQGRRDALLYPHEERQTALLTTEDPMLAASNNIPQLLDVDRNQFTSKRPSRATGPLQITHGDVCRACGYVDAIRYYQRPADHFRKAREDRALRWLLRTQGVAIYLSGVYRIRHIYKGRYATADSLGSRIRTRIRQLQSRLRDRHRQ